MYNTSTNYKNTVLADSTKHVLKLYIGQRQIEPNHIFDFTINAEMFSDELYLGATPMKSCSFKIYKDEIQSGDTEIRVVSGIEGEEIPMGTYVFEDIKEVDFFTYEIIAVDYMYKFEGAYVTDLDFSEGVTLLEVLNDLCEKSDVVLGSESFINDDTVIAVYDSTLQRKEYLSYIAEQAGGFAIIGRDNQLYINTFNHTENASELNLNNFKSFKWGQQTSISKIAYEDGIQDFKKGDDSSSTLWIAQKNMYITSQSQIDNIYDELTETEREIEAEGTSITIEDSKEGVKIDYSIEGNTTQNGTPTPSSPVPVNNVTGEQIIGTYKHNFLSLKDNIEWRADNTITKTIIDDDNITISYSGENATYKRLWQDNNLQIPNGHYDISSIATCTDNNVMVGIGIDVYPLGSTTRSDWHEIWFTQNAREQGVRVHNDFEIDNSQYYYRIRFFLSQITGTTSNSVQFKDIMLKKYGDEIEYEIYQGKKYEINLGKNLLQYSNFSNRTENGITITNNNDGTFLVNGTATADISLVIDSVNFIPMKGTWRMVGCPSGGSSSTYMLSAYVGYWGGGSPNIDIGNGTSITYTGNVKVRFYIKSGTTCNNLLFKPMVTYDLNATYEDFAPYFEPIELNKIGTYQDFIKKGTGKNLNNGIDYKFYISNNATQYRISGTDTGLCIKIDGASSYTISTTTTQTRYRVACSNSLPSTASQNCFNGVVNDGTNNNITINTNGYKYLLVNATDLNAIQIEKGSSATYYEPYGYKDKWYIEKNVGKTIVNGSESCSRQVLSGNIVRFIFTGRVDGIGGARQTIFSNYFAANLNSANDREGIGFVYGNLLYLYKQEASVADFQTWLNTHNTSVYYVLNAPEYTLIENEELINQLDELDNATLMEGTTNILVSGDLPFIMNLDFEVRNRNFYQFEGGSIVDPANDLGDVVIIDEKPVIFEGKMSYLGKWYIDVNSTALVKDKAHSMNTKTDTRAKIRRVESQINQIKGEITQVVEATEEISKDYVTNSEYTTYKTETTQNMKKLSQQVSQTVETLYGENDDGLVKKVEKTETDISQNAKNITLSVGRISSLETKTEELDDNTKKIVKSFKFNDDGLTISNQGSDEDDGANINIDSKDIKIRVGTATKLLINDSGIYYDSASFHKLDLGEFAIVAEENGLLSIIYEGR